jgi:hypothetical protein
VGVGSRGRGLVGFGLMQPLGVLAFTFDTVSAVEFSWKQANLFILIDSNSGAVCLIFMLGLA